VSRQLSKLVRRAVRDRDQAFLLVTGDEPRLLLDWGATPSAMARALEGAGHVPEADLSRLVLTALARFDGLSGRRILLLVTDGRHAGSRAGWKEAEAAVAAAGVPVYVIGIWGEWFPERSRLNLERLVRTSGGRMQLLQNPTQLGEVVDQYIGLIRASVVLRFRYPADAGDKAHKIKLRSQDERLRVHHPKTLR
jgi:Mg-chelatase subunit ChlD